MRWRAALLMASPTFAVGEALSIRPTDTATMIAVPIKGPSWCRILRIMRFSLTS